jgi:hypothetical protein
MRTSTRAAIAVGTILALSFGGGASAHYRTFRTAITVARVEIGSTTALKGEVRSPKPACVPDRKVKVFRVKDGPDFFIAADKTNAAGKWQVSLGESPPGGSYYGKAVRRNIGPSGHRHICRAATSNQVAVPQTAPTMTINHPTDGVTYQSGNSISFIGAANDPQDGDLSGASIVWTSSIDGQIGTGTSFQSSLSVGSHEITATATDSDGKTGTDTINITVTS